MNWEDILSLLGALAALGAMILVINAIDKFMQEQG